MALSADLLRGYTDSIILRLNESSRINKLAGSVSG